MPLDQISQRHLSLASALHLKNIASRTPMWLVAAVTTPFVYDSGTCHPSVVRLPIAIEPSTFAFSERALLRILLL